MLKDTNTKYHHGDEVSEVVFKMSDKPEGSDSNQGSREEETEDSSKAPSLKEATHKLKAEALRRLQLGGADYEGEGAKKGEARQGSSQNDNSNEQDTGIDGGDRGEIQAEKSDVSREERDSNADITDHNVAGSNLSENKESGSFSQDSGKPEDNISGDSVANVGDVNRQNKQESDMSANEGDPASSEVKDQSISKGNMSSSQGENTKQSVSDKTFSKDSRPTSAEGQEGASRTSRPSSGGARPGSWSKGADKGEGSPQKPSSRPGSGSGSRSRPGSGSKRSRQEGQSGSRPGSTSGRPGSTSNSRSRPQSGSKGTANIDRASVNDGKNKFAGDQSQSKLSKDEGGGSTEGKTTSSGKIIEGASQTLGADSDEQRQQHHGDTSNLAVNNKSADNTSVQTLSGENKSESKDGDKISDDVSPPMSEGLGSKGQGVNSKQYSDSLSNDKQDSGMTEAGKGAKEGEHSDSVQDDKGKTSGADQAGEGDAKSGEQRDASEASHVQGKDGSKDETTSKGQEGQSKTSDKDGSKSDATIDKKPSAEEHEADVTEKSGVQTDERSGDKDGAEESSGKQITKSEKGDTAAADAGEEKKEDGDGKTKKKKKTKKENAEQEEEIEDEESEGAEETGKAAEELQPAKAKQDAPGRDKTL